MYDLHTHSLLSDGALLPSEVAARYQNAGFKVIAICDHADYSNIDNIVDSIINFSRNWPAGSLIKVLPGVELTHLPLSHFRPLAEYSRSKGVKIIVGHGQSPVEPVIAGTNRAALEAGIDILAHPGLITDDDVMLAKERGTFLEITCRGGHDKGNRHVVKQALKFGAKLVIDTDSHSPSDIPTYEKMRQVGLKAGLKSDQVDRIFSDVREFLRTKGVELS
ncbi:MAG: histidinol phosphate phosphatase domain-containing protein [Candidatus Omnitrophota bacterium]